MQDPLTPGPDVKRTKEQNPDRSVDLGRSMAIMESLREDLVHFLYRRTRDYHAAEDLCQEAMIKAYRSITTLESADKIKGWLYSIAFNTTVDWIRNQAAKKKNALLAPSPIKTRYNPSTEAVLISKEEELFLEQKISALWSMVRELPPIYREVFELRYEDRQPIARIAWKTGVPENNVKVRLFRARRLLECRWREQRERTIPTTQAKTKEA